MSWGAEQSGWLESYDRFYDELVYGGRRTVVASAGNNGSFNCAATAFDDYVMSPASAYNVIAVGAYDDRNTMSIGDDAMSLFSACHDPKSVHDDREKPELVAPGENILSLDDAEPWGVVEVDGTSRAAPMVSGTAALLMESNPFLVQRPEAIKAILMASAVTNIEGAARLSDKDGAGGVRVVFAEQLARNHSSVRFHQRSAVYCLAPATGSSIEFARVSLAAGQRMRVALAWSTDPDLTSYARFTRGQPHIDLDLLVHRVSNNLKVAESISRDNTYEIVDFTAATAGEYSLRQRVTCSAGSFTPVGKAVFGF